MSMKDMSRAEKIGLGLEMSGTLVMTLATAGLGITLLGNSDVAFLACLAGLGAGVGMLRLGSWLCDREINAV